MTTNSSIKRICLFVGFNKTGRVADYVFYYLEQLAKSAEVYYWADGPLAAEDIEKLNTICRGVYGERRLSFRICFYKKNIIIRLFGRDIINTEKQYFKNQPIQLL